MQPIQTRRSFARHLSFLALAAQMPRFAHGKAPESALRLTVDAHAQGPLVPVDFVGLSYENMQLEDPSFFSPENRSLVEQFRAIAPRGVLRLGGNTSEFGWWKPNASDVPPKRVDSPWKAAGEPTAATVFAITPQAIDNLNGFLKATGWKCIYGLNLGYGNVETDLPEARYVFNTLGPRLEYFQVGNEVDLFKGHLRDPATWNVDTYLQEWLRITVAVTDALPGARFGLPDVASDVHWLPEIADRWAGLSAKPQVVSLSHHYYWSGPPSNPAASIENLLRPSAKVASDAELARTSAAKLGPDVTYRMTEGNTVYRGGKYGVSDVFASALWSADYLLELMKFGYAGVNLHGGSGHAQAVSVGGVFHGEALMKDPTVPHPKPFYTPIANQGTLAGAGVDGKLNSTYLLEPVGYGMKFAALFAGATMLPVSVDFGSVNATAYAARRADGRVMVAVLNKSAGQPLSIDIGSCTRVADLEADALDSRNVSLKHVSRSEKAGTPVTISPHTASLFLLK
jgi:hypothetical protein